MTDLGDYLITFFSFPVNISPDRLSLHNAFYNSPKSNIVRITSEKFDLKCRIGHMWKYPKGDIEVVEYSPMKKIERASAKCKAPLSFMEDSSYGYYGCYLTVASFLRGIKPDKMNVVCGPDNNRVITFRYKEEIAKYILSYRLKELRDMPETIVEISKQLTLYG
jgi:hypothetical protein